VVTKILVSLATTVPAIVIVLLPRAAFLRQRPPAGLAVAGHRGHGLVRLDDLFAALAVAIGYRFAPEQVQPDHPDRLLHLRHPRRPCGSR